MAQFDESTKRKAEEYKDKFAKPIDGYPREDFTAGRNSCRESLEVLQREVQRFANYMSGDNPEFIKSGWQKYPDPRPAQEAIAQVKAQGNWCLDTEAEEMR